ncbi:NAD-dependent epimerase/dehydratase family protein [Yersinia enterocolitica]|uniref:NAD-dependent epimerase/dehydratase family protein n=1 Tax=Yersinia enterocolitica TaxID=630 RepID=UPI0028DDEAE2|nr:NAD-dependent epimerase/dehydratase family protein [Yersinia enterocolitica]HDZ9834032.1 NAD-dependent epimerase/dehydratase family protein [Yersinia enterocolitica]HEC1640653.1 NAD-dependent epimerase/dehydratase family protein [Yersinia enterocolitica]HEN3296760.1 NAD-dependent epimerase/dehydratase family protein [Yersinia enterocolitica]
MKIALIGGSGFIGTNLAAKLIDNGLDFSILDKVQSTAYPHKWVYCDVMSKETLEKTLAGYDTIINLAAEHKDNVRPISLYYDVNVSGARNICAVAEDLDIKTIVFTSSVAVYGFVEEETDENGQYAPFNHYGKSKLEAERVYDEWHTKNPAKTLVTIRPTVVFGIGNRGNVYNLFKQISSGRFLMIGSGDNEKSMAYVENIAEFLASSVKFSAGYHLINYVDKPDFTMNQLTSVIYSCLGKKNKIIRVPYLIGMFGGYLFDILSSLTGKEFSISSIRIKKFCAKTQFSSSSIKNYNFTPSYSLKDAVIKTVKSEFISK